MGRRGVDLRPCNSPQILRAGVSGLVKSEAVNKVLICTEKEG